MSQPKHDVLRVPADGYSLERFFELSLDLHVIASADGYFKFVSSSVTQVLGWSAAELRAKPFLDFVHPDDHAATLAEVERQTRAGERVLHFENRYRHRDGTWRVLAWKSMPAGGFMYATARDVTAEKLLQQSVLDAKQAAEAANRELESFSYSVAHDLRAPLRSIDGFSQLLLEDCGEAVGDTGRRYLGVVRESTRHMAQLIDDLLKLSRVTRSELTRDTVDLSALANAVLERLRAAEPQRQVEARVEAGLTHWADARLIGVVLENLLGNAWKYTGKRALAVIELGRTVHDGAAAYFVRDNGAGFDPAYTHKLFGVFERLHSVQEFEGTGIGLATVQRIVARHGGRAWAEGKVDAGATFYFTLGPKEPT